MSHVRSDRAEQAIFNCLQSLPEDHQEGMFVVSNLKYVHYLDHPDARSLRETDRRQGDFDVIILHKKHGLLIGECKAVGDKPASNRLKDVQERVVKAIGQLKKGEDFIRKQLGGFYNPRAIRKTLMLPNVTKADLHALCNKDERLREDLRRVLSPAPSEDLFAVCLTKDNVSSAEDWWQCRMTQSGVDDAMTDDVFLDLIARFAGFATTVKVFCQTATVLPAPHKSDVRTPGEAIAETGDRFASSVNVILLPDQVDVINNEILTRVFLTGPPGTGKTLVLVLKGRQWLRRGNKVHVVSLRRKSLAAAYMIAHQLRLMEPDFAENVELHVLHLHQDGGRAAERFVNEHPAQQELYVILDECWELEERWASWYDFCQNLAGRHGGRLHLWAAGLFASVLPECLQEVRLTQSLRSPPPITSLIREHRGFQNNKVHDYTACPAPAPAPGFPPVEIFHGEEGHAASPDPQDCTQCGREIAKLLQSWDVGLPEARSAESPTPLAFRDVFLLTYQTPISDTSNLLTGLREGKGGFPVTVLDPDDQAALEKVATMTEDDVITAADCEMVNGLERKVVIFVEHEEREAEDWGRLWAMSRCVSALVRVRPGRRAPQCEGMDWQ